MVSMTSLSLTPFIPFVVKPFLCSRNALPGGERVFFLDLQIQQVHSLPLAWTNLALPDPFVVVARGKAMLRWSDLHLLGAVPQNQADPQSGGPLRCFIT